MDLERYSKITNKNKREIVLLKGFPCKWGRCTFCDYIEDNDTHEEEMIKLNNEILKNVTGEFKQLEVINSGSCFELPEATLKEIKEVIQNKAIDTLYFESHWIYKNRLNEIRDFFSPTTVIFKTGIETFDDNFRNNILKKGIKLKTPYEAGDIFDSVCLMFGIEGQTKESITYDIDCALKSFKRICINIYIENSTKFKRDEELIKWFKENYSYLEENPSVEILWNNTDFGVGGELNE